MRRDVVATVAATSPAIEMLSIKFAFKVLPGHSPQSSVGELSESANYLWRCFSCSWSTRQGTRRRWPGRVHVGRNDRLKRLQHQCNRRFLQRDGQDRRRPAPLRHGSGQAFASDRDRVEHLFGRYEALVNPLERLGIARNRRVSKKAGQSPTQ